MCLAILANVSGYWCACAHLCWLLFKVVLQKLQSRVRFYAKQLSSAQFSSAQDWKHFFLFVHFAIVAVVAAALI